MVHLRLLLLTLAAVGAPPAPAPAPAPAEVVLAGVPVVKLLGRLGPFDPAERARAITSRLERLAAEPGFDPARLRLQPGGQGTDLLDDQTVLLTLTDADTVGTRMSREALAGRTLGALGTALAQHRQGGASHGLLFGGLYTLLATTALGLLIWLIWRLSEAFSARISRWMTSGSRGLRIQNLQVVTPQRAGELMGAAVRVLRLALTLLLLYVYLPTVLSFFPFTRGLADTLLGYVLSPLQAMGAAAMGYLPRFFFVVVMVIIARQLTRVVYAVFREIERGNLRPRGFYIEWVRPTYQLARALIVVFTAIVIFPYLPGAESSAFQNISIFVGVLVSLGSSSAVANTVAGVIITRAFKIGDMVTIAEAEGVVIEKTLLVTRVRTLKNVEVSIPNAMVMTSHVQNHSANPTGVILHFEVTIGYDVPWRQVHELLREAAGKAQHLLAEPRPFVLQSGLDDFYVRYELNAYTSEPALMLDIYSDLRQRVQDAFFEAGVEIMSPHYGALRDGNGAAIPEGNLPAGYQAPGFRVEAVAAPVKKASDAA